MPQGLDQRFEVEKVVPKMARRNDSDAGHIYCANVSSPQRGGAVPTFLREVGRNGKETTPRGPTNRSPPIIYSVVASTQCLLFWKRFGMLIAEWFIEANYRRNAPLNQHTLITP